MGVEVRELSPSHGAEAASVLEQSCAFDSAATVANEKLFLPAAAVPAHPVGAWEEGTLVGVAVGSGHFLRLLAVLPAARGRGVGCALLASVSKAASDRGEKRLVTMAQPGNYLSPGVDTDNRDAIDWLQRRGFSHVRDNENLIINLVANDKVTREAADARIQAARSRGCDVRRIDDSTMSATLAMVGSLFSPAGAAELQRAAQRDVPAVHIALDQSSGEIAAFAAHDGNNAGLGWFGPAGTDERLRGAGLGAALLLCCLLDVRGDGHDVCEVAWIGPAEFYEKVAGPCRRRRFAVYQRSLP